MPEIRKDIFITVLICVLFFGFTSIALAQEKVTDEILMGLIAEGEESLDKNDLDSASRKIQEAYEKAIKEKSLNTEINNELSSALFKVGETVLKENGSDKARSWLEKSVNMNAKNDEAHLMLGWTYFDKKDFGKAINYFNTANAVNPSAKSYQFIALTYFQNKSYKKAFEACNKGLGKNPTNKEASAMLNLRALVNLAMGNKEQAEEDYLSAMKKDPGSEIVKSNYELFFKKNMK